MNNKGFTLVEMMIAIGVLTIGILGVAVMQSQAILFNAGAFSRTDGNVVALSFMEEIQRIPYDDPVLNDGGGGNDGSLGLDDGLIPPNGVAATTADGFPDLVVTQVDQSILDAGFLGSFSGLGNTYNIQGAGAQTRLVDEANREYVLFFNVDTDPWGDSSESFKIIKLFVYWQTPTGGVRYTALTTTKYNNT